MRAWCLVLLLVPGTVAAPQLVAVVPDLPGPGPLDEGLAVADLDGPTDLAGYSLEDGEGTWAFPSGSIVGPEPYWVVGDLALWQAVQGPTPAASWNGTPSFALANTGETVCLHGPDGKEADCFTWGPGGDVGLRSPGLVYSRHDEGWATPRIHRIGESDLPPRSFAVDSVQPYASPDHSFQILSDLIDSATARLHLHVYDLRHTALTEHLVAAAERGVDVQVLVDGRVVGQDADARDQVAHHLADLGKAGATTVMADGGRYTHHHLKVLVADDAVAVQSENWVLTGVPLDPSWGNRGWGAVVQEPALADWMATWMAADRTAWDTKAPPHPTGHAPVRLPAVIGDHQPSPLPIVQHGGVRVTPLIAPDHTADPRTDPLLRALQNATTRIWTQQLRMDPQEDNAVGWDRPDRYTTALAEAAARGVDVRVQLQGPFGTDDDNREAEVWLRDHGVDVQRPDPPGIVTLHNKGWIIDDAVVVGSMNGHHASRSNNREVALLIEGPDVARPYAAWFMADQTTPAWSLPPAPLPILFAIIGVAATLRRT